MPVRCDLLPGAIRRRLTTDTLARRIYVVPEVDSTNRLAADMAKAGEPEGTMVVADYQTEGRGRYDRRWVSPAGRNLLFSLILRPRVSPRSALGVTLACALSIAETLESVLECDTAVKWPNDVLARDAKVCGILSETAGGTDRVDYLVVGIGINVNMTLEEFPSGLRYPATSCRIVTGREHDRAVLLGRVVAGLESIRRDYERAGFAGLTGRYDRRLADRGRVVTIKGRRDHAGGRVTGVAEDGALIIEQTGGQRVSIYDNDAFEA